MTTPVDPPFPQACSKQQCECEITVNKSIVGMGTFIDAKFQMNADFGAYVKAELVTTRGFDLFISFFPPVLDVGDAYTLLDDTKANTRHWGYRTYRSLQHGEGSARQWRFVECCLLRLC